jgi:ABC-type lipoprotein release transport system permease subunit
VEAFDIGIWTMAAAALAAVALGASALPTLRAVRVNPVGALRVG